MTKETVTGHAWDNTSEYKSLTSEDYKKDLAEVASLIERIAQASQQIIPLIPEAEKLTVKTAEAAISTCQNVSELSTKCSAILWTLSSYANCEFSVDGKSEDAKKMIAQTQVLGSQFEQALTPVSLFLNRATDEVVAKYLESPKTKHEAFGLKYQRRHRDFLLSLGEENLISAMKVNGIVAWSNLYDSLVANLSCEVDLPEGKRTTGVAEISGMLSSENPAVRKAAWFARNAAWEKVEDTCAQALNSIVGWRADEYAKRSVKRPLHFLDLPLHQNRIERKTLDAMFGVVSESQNLSERALHFDALMMGKTKLDPWDLTAPAPAVAGSGESKKLAYEDGLKIVIDAFSAINPEMGEFVKMMDEKKWIEGRVLPTKRHGAYCTGFYKSRTPRVFMTYMGSTNDVLTLAHELGHAFHSWVMRDLSLQEIEVPMTLAETASIFGETVTCDVLMKRAASETEQFRTAWTETQRSSVFLMGIPARFELEKTLYETRVTKTLSAKELKDLSVNLFQKHFGKVVDMSTASMNWASTLHFYISELSFYNFPYTFGYLFSLGVYAQWQKRGTEFYKSYVSLLRDTGRMTAEDLIQKHLGMDITKPEFWRDSMSILAKKVDHFERLCQGIFANDDRR